MGKADARVKALTKRSVDAAKPEAARYTIWDDKLKGFGLRVEPRQAGGGPALKTFIARYRAGGGRGGTLRQKTVGRYGTVTVDQARISARKLLGAASAGGDPVGEARESRQAGITVTEVVDWYMREAEAGRLLGRRGRPIKPLTLSTDRGRIEAHVKPLLGKRSMRSLSIRDIEEMQSSIAAGKTAKTPGKKRVRGTLPSGGGGAGGRTLAMLRAIFEHAVRRQLISSNPAKGARKIANTKRTHRLSLDDLRAFGADIRSHDENPTAVAAIRLMALTGFRRNEALALRPGWLVKAGAVGFPDTKVGPQVRPIGRAAVALIEKQITKAGESEWVFPADRGEGHFIGAPRVLARIAKRAKLKVTLHVFRHTFASVAAELGFSELTIAGLLGHSAGSVTSGYVHLDAALVTAADRVSAVIAAALDGKPAAEVVPLRSEAI